MLAGSFNKPINLNVRFSELGFFRRRVDGAPRKSAIYPRAGRWGQRVSGPGLFKAGLFKAGFSIQIAERPDKAVRISRSLKRRGERNAGVQDAHGMQIGYSNTLAIEPGAHSAELILNRLIAGPCDLDAPHQR